MPGAIHTSKVHIKRQAGPLRIARLPGELEPVVFGVRGPSPSVTSSIRRVSQSVMPLPPVLCFL